MGIETVSLFGLIGPAVGTVRAQLKRWSVDEGQAEAEDAICDQLDALVKRLAAHAGQPPCVFYRSYTDSLGFAVYDTLGTLCHGRRGPRWVYLKVLHHAAWLVELNAGDVARLATVRRPRALPGGSGQEASARLAALLDQHHRRWIAEALRDGAAVLAGMPVAALLVHTDTWGACSEPTEWRRLGRKAPSWLGGDGGAAT